jgi:hypothetical protein
MKHTLPPLTKDLIEAYAASAVLWAVWLLGVILKLGAASGSQRLRRFVEVSERAVESIMFLKALHRFGPTPRRARIPRGAPRGFRRVRGYQRRRLFFRNAGICARKASPSERVARLCAALANPAPHVDYFYRRLVRGLRGPRLIPVSPPASGIWADAPHAVPVADSS